MLKRIFLFLLVTVLIAGCDEDDENTNESTNWFTASKTDTMVISTGGFSGFGISVLNGNIRTVNAANDSITIKLKKICESEDSLDAEAHVDRIEFRVSHSNDQVNYYMSTPEGDPRRYKANLLISVPVKIALALRSSNGNIDIEDHQANLKGVVTNGNVEADLTLLPNDVTIDLSATNGNVLLDTPSIISAAFDAVSVNGSVTVAGFSAINYEMNEEKHKKGTIGGGEAEIILQATNGNVRFQGNY